MSSLTSMTYVDEGGKAQKVELERERMEGIVHMFARAYIDNMLYHVYKVPGASTVYTMHKVFTAKKKTAPYQTTRLGDPAQEYAHLKAAEVKSLVAARELSPARTKAENVRLLQAEDRKVFAEELAEQGVVIGWVGNVAFTCGFHAGGKWHLCPRLENGHKNCKHMALVELREGNLDIAHWVSLQTEEWQVEFEKYLRFEFEDIWTEKGKDKQYVHMAWKNFQLEALNVKDVHPDDREVQRKANAANLPKPTPKQEAAMELAEQLLAMPPELRKTLLQQVKRA